MTISSIARANSAISATLKTTASQCSPLAASRRLPSNGSASPCRRCSALPVLPGAARHAGLANALRLGLCAGRAPAAIYRWAYRLSHRLDVDCTTVGVAAGSGRPLAFVGHCLRRRLVDLCDIFHGAPCCRTARPSWLHRDHLGPLAGHVFFALVYAAMMQSGASTDRG